MLEKGYSIGYHRLVVKLLPLLLILALGLLITVEMGDSVLLDFFGDNNTSSTDFPWSDRDGLNFDNPNEGVDYDLEMVDLEGGGLEDSASGSDTADLRYHTAIQQNWQYPGTKSVQFSWRVKGSIFNNPSLNGHLEMAEIIQECIAMGPSGWACFTVAGGTSVTLFNGNWDNEGGATINYNFISGRNYRFSFRYSFKAWGDGCCFGFNEEYVNFHEHPGFIGDWKGIDSISIIVT